MTALEFSCQGAISNWLGDVPWVLPLTVLEIIDQLWPCCECLSDIQWHLRVGRNQRTSGTQVVPESPSCWVPSSSLMPQKQLKGLAREEMPFVLESCSMVLFVRKHGNLSSNHRHPGQPCWLQQHALSAALYSAAFSKGWWGISNYTIGSTNVNPHARSCPLKNEVWLSRPHCCQSLHILSTLYLELFSYYSPDCCYNNKRNLAEKWEWRVIMEITDT